MLKGLPSYGPVIERQWVEPEGHAGLGAIHPVRISQPGQFAQDPSSGMTCVVDGVIYRNTRARQGNPVEPNGAALLLERFLRSGTECLSETSGSFNVAWWDSNARRLVLANDKLGNRLLFYGLRGGRLVFASMLARVMAATVLSSEVDVGGLADLLNCGHTLGERTLFKDVRILPPGRVLTYDRGELHVQQYWFWDHIEAHGRYDARRLDELEDVFKTAVRRSVRPDLTSSLALTGGLDSRCVLAAAVNQGLPLVTHTGGQPDSTDVVLAQEVAAQAGVRHTFGLLSPDGLGERLWPMVRHQGGILATLRSHPVGLFNSLPAFDAQVEGTAGEIARGTWLSAKDLGAQDRATVTEILGARVLTKTAKRLDAERLWRPEFLSLAHHAAEENLKAVLSGYRTQGSPLLLYDYFGVEHTRKILNKATLIVRAVMEDYFPYLDHQWLEAVLAIPVSERVTKRIQIDLIKRLCPPLLNIVREQDLVPLSASPQRVQLAKQYRRFRRRLARRFRWVGSPPAKVPCSYDWQWSRGEMRPVLTKLLYNPDAAFRAYLRWETVEPALDQHFSGQKAWMNLVAALAVFEIAHGLWVAS